MMLSRKVNTHLYRTVEVKSYTKLATPTMYQSIVFSPPLYAKKFQTLVYSNVFSPLPGWL